MPKGAAPAGSGVGELGSSVRLPPSTANPLTASARVSTTQSALPSGPRRASSAPAPVVENGVLPSSVSTPSGAIACRERNRRAGQRAQKPAGVEREARVVAPRVAGVRDVDELVVDGDAHRLVAVRRDGTGVDGVERAVRLDAQYRDLIAACIDGKQ